MRVVNFKEGNENLKRIHIRDFQYELSKVF